MAALPQSVERALIDFVEAAKKCLGDHLKSIVLYGSAAEGRLRAVSDVNVILVLSTFERARVDALREPTRLANAAIKLSPMFLLETEVASAADTFAVKFADVLRRRKILFGADPFNGISISRQAEVSRLKQVLFNLTLRMRSTYVSRSLREEQLAIAIAETAGPLRSAASTFLELHGEKPGSPKEALERVAADLDMPNASELLTHLSEVREKLLLPPGVAPKAAFQLIELMQRLRKRVEAL